ncbi:universal stress protein [Lichenicoccus sp.]|uniref:universal stress protein n=1 Tax=Lichenicoccus sp. TaxID=2781899 RepID=UPI003D113205
MTSATFMVHLQPGRSNAALLQVAGDLAGRCGARLIGITACQPMLIVYNESCYMGDLIEQDRVAMLHEIADAEAEFRGMPGAFAGEAAWRSQITPIKPAEYLAAQARHADLVIVGAPATHPIRETRDPDLGALVMQAGRPVLVAPREAPTLALDRIMVAWKDTREARRATLDAVPLLKLATDVAVVEIASTEAAASARRRVADVAGWMRAHGIQAEATVQPSHGEDANQLRAVAQEMAADLVVAGAYGHGRLREWVLGGVTRDLLLHLDRCVLLSH